MPNKLFVRPSKIYQVESTTYEWALYDVAGDQLKYGNRSTLDMIDQTLMQNGIENVELLVLWPTKAAFVGEVNLPGNQARYLQQALPFSVEELVAQDIEQIHISLGAKNTSGGFSVVTIDRSIFDSYYQSFGELGSGFPLGSIHLDADCLTTDEDDFCLSLSDASVLLKNKEGKLVSLIHENLIPYLDSVFLEPHEEDGEQNLSMKVWVSTEFVDKAKMLIAQIEQYPHLSVQVEQYGMSEFEFLCECFNRSKQKPTDLCQGDFKTASKTNDTWRRWRSVIAVAAIGFLLQLGVFIGQGMHYEQQALEVGDRALASYKKITPNSKRVTLGKLPRIIKGKINQLRQGGGVTDLGFLDLLGEAGYQYDRSKDKGELQFKSINYNKQRTELVLEMQAQSFDQLENLKKAIVEAGLKAEISSVVQEKQFVRSRISVSGV